MTKRVTIKHGDIFVIKLETTQKFFQFIGNDISQMNSNVIRVFKKTYLLKEVVDFTKVIRDESEFHAHCIISLGIKLNLWEKVCSSILPLDKNIIFRNTSDYGGKIGKVLSISHDWYVWEINQDCKKVGKLTGAYKNAEIGIVVNPHDIIDRIRTGKYKFQYPKPE